MKRRNRIGALGVLVVLALAGFAVTWTWPTGTRPDSSSTVRVITPADFGSKILVDTNTAVVVEAPSHEWQVSATEPATIASSVEVGDHRDTTVKFLHEGQATITLTKRDCNLGIECVKHITAAVIPADDPEPGKR